jgi:hypothetical protein
MPGVLSAGGDRAGARGVHNNPPCWSLSRRAWLHSTSCSSADNPIMGALEDDLREDSLSAL